MDREGKEETEGERLSGTIYLWWHHVMSRDSIAEPSDKGSDTTIFTGNNKSGEDNSNSPETLYANQWRKYRMY
jgi:hypothetical protein